MKRREQALLLLRKAAQDEALLDQVLTSDRVSDEIIGFHCRQAAEKILKALLSDLGVRIRKTHEIGALMLLVAEAGLPLPTQFEDLDALTPFRLIPVIQVLLGLQRRKKHLFQTLQPFVHSDPTSPRSEFSTSI